MAYNISEYLSKLQDLATQNLSLLKSIDAAFHTKAEYVTATVGDNTFNIPSFISLENRFNTLQANFENLVNAPKTGTASFVFDGNTQTIQMGGFNICPEAVELSKPSNFFIEHNDVLKDFMTPKPYLSFSVSSIPNDITQCQVRKYVIFNDDLKSLLFSGGTRSVDYAVVEDALSGYTEDEDYQMYDTVMRLPVRDNIGFGSFKISSIVSSDVNTSDFTQTYTLILDGTSYSTDGTNVKNLKVGDILVTGDDSCQLEITEVNLLTSTVTVTVLNNGYANLMTYEDGGDLGKLKFYSSLDYDNNKHVDVPLEENQYIIVFIAPIYDLLNTRAQWSNGIAVDVFSLTVDIDGKETYFKDYYDNNVVNIGDGIFNLVAQMGSMMSDYSKDEFDTWSSAKPELGEYTVTQINSHISNSETYKEVKSLYLQKQNYKNELNTIQSKIEEINATLNAVNFDDTSNLRTVYEQQLSSYNEQKTELTNAINAIVKEISSAVNNADLSLDGAKYHIRSIFDAESFKAKYGVTCDILSLKILYRYKNALKETGQAMTIGNETFSDWNLQQSVVIKRQPVEKTLTNFTYAEVEQEGPQPTYFDIPISQGETVDIKFQVIYEPGYPFVEWTSDWSDITNIAFPEELGKDVTVLDIIEENNEDVKSYQFTSLLEQSGINEHCADKVTDQDITYFHRPEDISSGFYTSERRIIPLKDKLVDFSNRIQTLEDIANDSAVDDVTVYISDSTGFKMKLDPFADNVFQLQDWKSSNTVTYQKSTIENGQTVKSLATSNIRRNNLFINIVNESNHTVRMFAVQRGKNSSIADNKYAGMMKTTSFINGSGIMEDTLTNQERNKIIAFNYKDAFDSAGTTEVDGTKGMWVNTGADYTDAQNEHFTNGPFVVYDETFIKNIELKSTSIFYNQLNSGEQIDIPVFFDAYMHSNSEMLSKEIQFTIRPSAFSEPLVYSVRLQQAYENTLEDTLRRTATTNNYKSISL